MDDLPFDEQVHKLIDVFFLKFICLYNKQIWCALISRKLPMFSCISKSFQTLPTNKGSTETKELGFVKKVEGSLPLCTSP